MLENPISGREVMANYMISVGNQIKALDTLSSVIDAKTELDETDKAIQEHLANQKQILNSHLDFMNSINAVTQLKPVEQRQAYAAMLIETTSSDDEKFSNSFSKLKFDSQTIQSFVKDAIKNPAKTVDKVVEFSKDFAVDLNQLLKNKIIEHQRNIIVSGSSVTIAGVDASKSRDELASMVAAKQLSKVKDDLAVEQRALTEEIEKNVEVESDIVLDAQERLEDAIAKRLNQTGIVLRDGGKKTFVTTLQLDKMAKLDRLVKIQNALNVSEVHVKDNDKVQINGQPSESYFDLPIEETNGIPDKKLDQTTDEKALMEFSNANIDDFSSDRTESLVTLIPPVQLSVDDKACQDLLFEQIGAITTIDDTAEYITESDVELLHAAVEQARVSADYYSKQQEKSRLISIIETEQTGHNEKSVENENLVEEHKNQHKEEEIEF